VLRHLTGSIAIVALIGGSAAFGQDRDGVRRTSAPARASLEFRTPDQPRQLDFDFGTGQGWLRSDGSYQLKASVQHTGLLCATYAVGLRFGVGPEGCENPASWTSPQILSTRRLCNNAPAVFEGNGQDPSVVANFDGIKCAQLLIRCDGNCK